MDEALCNDMCDIRLGMALIYVAEQKHAQFV